MSRRKIDPVERAFEFYISLTQEQQTRFGDWLVGYRRAQGLPPVQAAPPRKRAPKAKEVAAP